jgi:UDP-N-acetylmuramoyl-L-alanyl-D-glutamate--2,6-diaminopimelate ligase
VRGRAGIGATVKRTAAARCVGGEPETQSGSRHSDELSAPCAALRPHVAGRLIIVIGAGGDRDAGKRPLMGMAAAA